MWNKFPAMRVHSWGGFGSQLFTAHLVLRLKEKYPGRRIKVFVHTSGVTQRFTEFNFNAIGIESYEVNDFLKYYGPENRLEETRMLKLLKIKTMKLLKSALLSLHILEECSDEIEFSLTKPWSLDFRGHYTRIHLDSKLANHLYETLLHNKESLVLKNSSIVIHYRLGDLLSLDEKSPIHPSRVEALLGQLEINLVLIKVLTDSSVREYKEFVSGSPILSSLIAENLNPIDSMLLCVRSEVFIGTGSKVSIWVAIFREITLKVGSYLPIELNWAKETGLKEVQYYN